MKSFLPWLSFDQALGMTYPDVKLRQNAFEVAGFGSALIAVFCFLFWFLPIVSWSMALPLAITSVLFAAYFGVVTYHTIAILDQVGARIDPVFRDFCVYELTIRHSPEEIESSASLVSLYHHVELAVENFRPLERDVYDRQVKAFRDRLDQDPSSDKRAGPPHLRVVDR